MTPDQIFPIFFATWIVLGIAGALFYRKGSLQAKRRLHPWFAFGTGALFIGFVYAMFQNTHILLLVVPATVVIAFLNYKFISFCPACGRTLQPNPPWSRMHFCPK